METISQGHSHHGWEQVFTNLLVRQLKGEHPENEKSGLSFSGNSYNHLLLSRVSGYAFSAPLGRPALLDFLAAGENQGHCSFGGRNEINTSSHHAWISFAAAAAWLLALRRQDAAVLAPIRRW